MAANELTADEPDYVLPQNFYDGTLTYNHYDRLGGLVSFLKKTFRTDLVERLGENAATNVQASNDQANQPSESDMSICRVSFCVLFTETLY